MILSDEKNIKTNTPVTKFWLLCLLAVLMLCPVCVKAQILENNNDRNSEDNSDADGTTTAETSGGKSSNQKLVDYLNNKYESNNNFKFTSTTEEILNRSGGMPVTIPSDDSSSFISQESATPSNDESDSSDRGNTSSGSNGGSSGKDSSSLNVSNTTTVNDNGNITTTTDSGDIGSNIPTNIGDDTSSSISQGSTSLSGKEPISANDKTDKTEEKTDDTVYTGVYEGRRLFTDLMAQHCKINAEDVVKDINKMYDCLNQYITEMNNSNAAAKSKANEDFTLLQISVMRDLVATAITKLQNVNNFEETSQKYKEASVGVKTERDDNAVMVYTQSYMANILNSIRELQAQSLMFEAINGLAYIDPSVIDTDDDAKSSSKSGKTGGSSTSDSTIIQSTTTISSGDEGSPDTSADSDADYLGNNKCLENGQTVTCSEGEHRDKNGTLVYCIDGICTYSAEEFDVIGKRPETVTNTADSDNRTETIDVYAKNLEAAKKLSPDKFLQALEAYRQALENPNNPESIKADAKYYIDILNQAAPIVFAGQPCAKVKRELGLSISCNDWNN